MINHTSVVVFHLLGFSDQPDLKGPISAMLLLLYLITILGNAVVFSTICLHTSLHKPMYFFLLHLSFLDSCMTSVTLPKAVAIHLADNRISLGACITQVYFFLFFIGTEFHLLTAMAYDRYVAICNPLRYGTIMVRKTCVLLTTASWFLGILDATPYPLLLFSSSFCGHQNLNHFFCDVAELKKLTCSDTRWIVAFTFIIGVGLGMSSSILTFTSYSFIIATILGIRSDQGRHHAFSTCSAHLLGVVLFYLTVFSNYFQPKLMYDKGEEKIFGLIYAVLIPMVNPPIYTLRNKEVKKALQKTTRRSTHN